MNHDDSPSMQAIHKSTAVLELHSNTSSSFHHGGVLYYKMDELPNAGRD